MVARLEYLGGGGPVDVILLKLLWVGWGRGTLGNLAW